MFYRGYHFTNHAQERIEQRSISKDDVIAVLERPSRTLNTDKPGTVKFIRTIDDRTIHVIATHLAKDDSWLIVSVWVRGEDDRVPMSWQLLTAPFKLVWWLVKQLIKLLIGRSKP